MHNTVLVQVVDGREKLPDHVGCLDLVEVLIGCYTLIKGTAVHHLIDEVDLLLVFVHLDDLSNVGVIQLLQELDLFEQLSALTKLQVFFADDLDGSHDARDLVHGASHSAQGAFANDLMQVVVVFDVVVVAEVEFLRVELDTRALIGRIVHSVLEKGLEVLATESNHFF